MGIKPPPPKEKSVSFVPPKEPTANLPVPSFMRYFHRFDGESDAAYELRLRKQGVEFAPRTAEELALWTRFVEAALHGGQKPSTAVSWAIGLVLCRREVAEKGGAYR